MNVKEQFAKLLDEHPELLDSALDFVASLLLQLASQTSDDQTDC